MSSDRTRGNDYQLKTMKFHLNVRNIFLTGAVIKHWSRLPKVVVKVPALSDWTRPFATHLSMGAELSRFQSAF